MSFDAKTADLRWIGCGASWIVLSVEVSRDCESGSGAGVADEIEDFWVAVEGLGSPVFGDFGEQAVLDGIPFGSASRIVSNGHGEPKLIFYTMSVEVVHSQRVAILKTA